MRYYVNKNAQPNGDHEVHEHSCSFVPQPDNRVYLGDFATCGPAVQKARQHFTKANGCFYCSAPCHTG